jgi:hypothetical protein
MQNECLVKRLPKGSLLTAYCEFEILAELNTVKNIEVAMIVSNEKDDWGNVK